MKIEHANIGIILCIKNSQLCLYNTWSKSYRLFNTKSRDDWLILENIEIETWNIYMFYSLKAVIVEHETSLVNTRLSDLLFIFDNFFPQIIRV